MGRGCEKMAPSEVVNEKKVFFQKFRDLDSYINAPCSIPLIDFNGLRHRYTMYKYGHTYTQAHAHARRRHVVGQIFEW